MIKENKLVFLIGCKGSGKSTYFKAIQKDKKENFIFLNPKEVVKKEKEGSTLMGEVIRKIED